MKEFIKRNSKYIAIVMICLFGSYLTTLATNYAFESIDVRFDNTNTEITAGDVQGALEQAFQHVTDYNDIKDTIESGFLTTTSQTLIGAVNGLNDHIENLKNPQYGGMKNGAIIPFTFYKFGRIVFMKLEYVNASSNVSAGVWTTVGNVPDFAKPNSDRHLGFAIIDGVGNIKSGFRGRIDAQGSLQGYFSNAIGTGDNLFMSTAMYFVN